MKKRKGTPDETRRNEKKRRRGKPEDDRDLKVDSWTFRSFQGMNVTHISNITLPQMQQMFDQDGTGNQEARS